MDDHEILQILLERSRRRTARKIAGTPKPGKMREIFPSFSKCHPDLPDYGRGMCKKCWHREYRIENREKVNETARKSAHKQTLKKYGVTQDQYDSILMAANGICAACLLPLGKSLGSGNKKKNKLHLDHDHKTGKVRGIIHANCNVMLGFAKDDPEILRNAANYLEKNS